MDNLFFPKNNNKSHLKKFIFVKYQKIKNMNTSYPKNINKNIIKVSIKMNINIKELNKINNFN